MLAEIAKRLHEQMHKLPGMPSHSDAELLNRNLGARRLSAQMHGPYLVFKNRNAHHGRPPRVLVAWQEWIGGLFTGGRSRG
jgi:hypothetical protein